MTTKKIVLIIAGVVIVLTLVVALFIGGIVGFALYQINNSEAAAKAKDFLRTSETLKEDIGEVRDFGSIITGSINVANGSGQATLNLKVIGAEETVNAAVNLVYVNNGDWRVSAASYVNNAGERIDLLNPYDSQLLVPHLGRALLWKSFSAHLCVPLRLGGKCGVESNNRRVAEERRDYAELKPGHHPLQIA